MMRVGKFEKKLLGAMLLVSVIPLTFCLIMVGILLEEFIRIGLNPEIEQNLKNSARMYRTFFNLTKARHENVARLLLREEEFIKRVCSEQLDKKYLERAILPITEDGIFIKELKIYRQEQKKESTIRLKPTVKAENWIEHTVRIPVSCEKDVEVSIVFLMQSQYLRDYKKLNETISIYGHIYRMRKSIKKAYSIAFGLIIFFIVLISTACGMYLSRRVTRRISALIEGTKRASDGDLDYRIEIISRDEIGNLTESFNRMLHQLKEQREKSLYLERISAWQQVARNVAHEIKNPLTPILLAVQEMKHRYDQKSPDFERILNESVKMITEEVNSLRRMVTEFSRFAKLPDPEFESIEMEEFIKELCEQYRSVFSKMDLQFKSRLSSGVIVPADREMLRRVFTNLFDNSRNAGASKIFISLDAGDSSNRIRIEISDNGKGIEEKNLQKVFDPAFTTKKEGFGLGLAICKRVILQHGGNIKALRSEEGGAHFVITLPSKR
jgi:nitrogen fixation/metabolism regulation signal transduction histidine kinase